MQDLILTLHIIVCVLLVILILLQSGKEGMGVIFGGGNSSVFGSSGAGGILAKLTTLMAIIFVITSLSYTYVTSSRAPAESSILDVRIEDMPHAAKTAPAPGDKPATPDAAKPAAPAEQKDAQKTGQPDAAKVAPQDGPAKADTNRDAATTGDQQNASNPAPPKDNGQPDKAKQ